MPLFRGSSRFASLILSQHSRFNVTSECNKQEINDDGDERIGREVGDSVDAPEGEGARV